MSSGSNQYCPENTKTVDSGKKKSQGSFFLDPKNWLFRKPLPKWQLACGNLSYPETLPWFYTPDLRK